MRYPEHCCFSRTLLTVKAIPEPAALVHHIPTLIWRRVKEARALEEATASWSGRSLVECRDAQGIRIADKEKKYPSSRTLYELSAVGSPVFFFFFRFSLVFIFVLWSIMCVPGDVPLSGMVIIGHGSSRHRSVRREYGVTIARLENHLQRCRNLEALKSPASTNIICCDDPCNPRWGLLPGFPPPSPRYSSRAATC